MVDIKLYTVAEIREWLVNNNPVEGLSEQVIAPTRAWAIIHNPYVKDDDAIVASIFEDGQLAVFTASFPEMIEGKRIWWASTLYCYPQFTGRGYGMIVVGVLMEAHEPEMTYDRWGATETVEIFNHFGLQTIYTPRYHLSFKKINTTSFKGKLAYCAQELKRCLHPWPKQSKINYSLRYASYIDGEAYAFMREHRGNDLWLREQVMLNWIVRYPFAIGCTLPKRVDADTKFSANVARYDYKVIKVYQDGKLIGIYVLRQKADELAIAYLYYLEEDCRYNIFASIVDHIIVNKPKEFITENYELLLFVKKRLYFPKLRKEKVSLSLLDIKQNSKYTLQLGDGDSYA